MFPVFLWLPEVSGSKLLREATGGILRAKTPRRTVRVYMRTDAMPRKLTPEEEAAYAELAKAARRLREAQERAELKQKTRRGMGRPRLMGAAR